MSKFGLRERDMWMKALLASTERNTANIVGQRLAMYLNIATGRCNPSYAGVARDLGNISERTVIRTIAALEESGWIKIERTAGGRKSGGRHGNTNCFAFRFPPLRVTSECHPHDGAKGDTQMAPFATIKGDKSDPLRVTNPNVKR